MGVIDDEDEQVRLQKSVQVYLNLNTCIVNFRTSRKDIEEIIDIVVREGERTHIRLQEEMKA